MTNHEPYRERIVYRQGFGKTLPDEGMPSQDEIELRAHLQVYEETKQEITRLRKLLEQDQQKGQNSN